MEVDPVVSFKTRFGFGFGQVGDIYDPLCKSFSQYLKGPKAMILETLVAFKRLKKFLLLPEIEETRKLDPYAKVKGISVRALPFTLL